MIVTKGATVECTWDFASSTQKEPCDILRLEGNKGYLKMMGMSPNGPIEIYDKKSDKLIRTIEFEMPEHTAQALIQAVTNDLLRLRHKDEDTDNNDNNDDDNNDDGYSSPVTPDFLSTGENAIRTQKVLDAVLESYYGGREIGYWSRL